MPADGQDLALRKSRKASVKYSPQVATAICEALAVTPRGLSWLCAHRPEFPDATMVRRWRHEYPEFRDMLAEARRQQAELLAYQTLEIADDDRFDTERTEHRDGSAHERMNFEWVGRCKLACDMRMKLAGKLDPATWGEKIDANVNFGVVRMEDWAAQFR